MNKPIRIYGRLRKIGDDYYEAEYKDYRPDGTVFGYGFEDFSGERLEVQQILSQLKHTAFSFLSHIRLNFIHIISHNKLNVNRFISN